VLLVPANPSPAPSPALFYASRARKNVSKAFGSVPLLNSYPLCSKISNTSVKRSEESTTDNNARSASSILILIFSDASTNFFAASSRASLLFKASSSHPNTSCK